MLSHQRVPSSEEVPSILALHGFSGSGADFDAFAAALGAPLATLDLPGHGASRSCLQTSAEALLPQLDGALDQLIATGAVRPRPWLLGYSMGGRAALSWVVGRHRAGHQPFSGLILFSASPGIEAETERARRRRFDEQLARRLEQEEAEGAGLARFADAWEALPIIASQRHIAEPWGSALRARRRAQSGRGLAASLRGFGQGSMPPLWRQLDDLALPTLIVVGAEDPRYRAIGGRLVAPGGVPGAKLVVVEGAGHCVHLEQPQPVAAALRRFMAEHRERA